MTTPTFPSLILRASAGTGKTFQLTNRYLQLLLAGESCDRILAVTFSRKAAKEIEQRIFERLALACESEQSAADLGEKIGSKALTRSVLLEQLTRLTRNQHRLRISTLDSFFIEIARLFSYELGLPSEWTIFDESEQKAVQLEVVRRSLQELGAKQSHEVLKKLKSFAGRRGIEERIALRIGELMSLVLDTEDAAWKWIDPGAAPSESDLTDAIESFKSIEIPKKKANTPDKNFLNGTKRLLEQLQNNEWEEILKAGLGSKVLQGEESYQRRQIPPEMVALVKQFIQAARYHILSSHRADLEMTRDIFSILCSHFNYLLKNSGGLTFDAVTRLLAESQLKDDLDLIAYRLDGKIHHLLLDEFQDTAIVQWKVLEPLANEILSKAGKEHSFFCVGDIKQAIYGWRGGVADIFDYLEHNFPVKSEDLSKSYRSSQVILDFANTVFSHLGTASSLRNYSKVIKRWDNAYNTHFTELDLPGYVRLELLKTDKNQSRSAPYERTLELVSEIHNDTPDAEIAVLVRTNQAIPELLALFDRHEIAASDEAGSTLVAVPAVAAIISLLKFIDHPEDQISLFHLKSTPILKVLEISPDQDSSTIKDLLQVDILLCGIGSWLKSLCEKLRPYVTHQDYIALGYLTNIVFAQEEEIGMRFSPLVEMLRKKKVLQPAPGVVRVMTIHKAKGLEFDAVILPQLEQSLLPQYSPFIKYQPDKLHPAIRVLPYVGENRAYLSPEYGSAHQAHLEEQIGEELSVFYVALTRAKQALYLISNQSTSKSSSPPPSYRSILAETLKLEPKGEDLIFEQGSRDWHRNLKSESNIPQEVFPAAQNVALNKAKNPRILIPQRPSEDPDSKLNFEELIKIVDPQWARRGTLLHSLCEQIDWLNDKPDSQQLLCGLNHLPFSTQDKQGACDLFVRLLENKTVQSWFLKENFTKTSQEQIRLYRELPFLIREDQQIINGIVDRVVIVSDNQGKPLRGEVLDFKSGIYREESEYSKRVDSYRPQMRSYQNAIAKLFGLDQRDISTKLCFLEMGRDSTC